MVKREEVPEYIKKIMRLLYEGDSNLYYEYDKELFLSLIDFLNMEIKKGIKGKIIDDVTASDKTITNIGAEEEKINKKLRSIIFDILEQQLKNGRLPEFHLNVRKGKGTIAFGPIDTCLFFFLAGKHIEFKSGSMRSELGKISKDVYLSRLFESLGIEKNKQIIETIQNGQKRLIKEKPLLHYVLNSKFSVSKNSLRLVKEGREIDGVVYLYDPNKGKLNYLLAMEFTTTGPGNPSFQRNKASDLYEGFKNTEAALVFSSFDLKPRMRRSIRVENTIYFKEDRETEPLIKIYHILKEKLIKLGYEPSTLLPPLENAKENFKERFRE